MRMPLFLSMIKEVYRPSPGVMGGSGEGRGTVAFSCLWFLSSRVLCWLFFFLLWPSTRGSNFKGEGFLLAYSSKGYSSWWWGKCGGRNRGGWWVQSEDSGELLVSPKASPHWLPSPHKAALMFQKTHNLLKWHQQSRTKCSTTWANGGCFIFRPQ